MRILKLFIFLFLSGAYLAGISSGALAEKFPSNGKQIDYFADGKTIAMITWRRDDQVLRRKYFHDNGKLYRDIIYQDGLRIIERMYYRNGRLKSVWTAKTHKIKLYDKKGRFQKQIHSPR